MSALDVRPAQADELDALANLWFQGWRDAHLAIVPEALVALRTLESFTERLRAALPGVRVLGPVGAPLGFHFIKGDELNQFYLAAEARGTGAAAALMADAEARLAQAGIATPWLACAIGNAAPPASTRRPAGRWPARISCRPKSPAASSRWRSGATRKRSRTGSSPPACPSPNARRDGER